MIFLGGGEGGGAYHKSGRRLWWGSNRNLLDYVLFILFLNLEKGQIVKRHNSVASNN